MKITIELDEKVLGPLKPKDLRRIGRLGMKFALHQELMSQRLKPEMTLKERIALDQPALNDAIKAFFVTEP